MRLKNMKPIKLKLFGINVLEFGSLPDGNPPQKQTKFLSPRYEPSNIATDADVLRITEAMRLAESGDTQELFRFYRDVLLSDDHIAGEFSTRKLVSLDSLLPNEPEHITAAKISDLRNKVDSTQKRLRLTKERRARLLADVEAYEGTGLGEDDRLAMLAILMHRYAKRIPQTGLFSENADPDPSRPLAVDSSVFEASRLHLFHSYGRPYYFGIDDLCDASSENAEQFLRLAAILVEAIDAKSPGNEARLLRRTRRTQER